MKISVLKSKWKTWIKSFIPQKVADGIVLGFFSVLSMRGLGKSLVAAHRLANDSVLSQKNALGLMNGYIENQAELGDFLYGKKRTADYNSCEVIALYNCLLSMKESDLNFAALLEYFEKKGITYKGEFGTSPKAIQNYLTKLGYQTELAIGKRLNYELLTRFQNQYDSYFLTIYNHERDITKQIHTVSITREKGKYKLHNAGTKLEFESLHSIMNFLKVRHSKTLCLCGISRKG